MSGKSGRRTWRWGVISLVHDHHQRQLQERIAEIQHDCHTLITSTTHVHMDHHNCLGVAIVRDKAKAVQELAERLTALKRVKNG